MTPPVDDVVTQTRIDLAEIKGMLTQVITTHEARIAAIELRVDAHDSRLNEKKATIARHDERIKGCEDAINDLENDNSARWGRNTGLLSLIIAGLVAIWNIVPGL